MQLKANGLPLTKRRACSAFISCASAGHVARRTNEAIKRANIWARPALNAERAIKLLMSILLKKSLLELTFNADEPFFGTSGTVPETQPSRKVVSTMT
jgi:hypothetical protein